MSLIKVETECVLNEANKLSSLITQLENISYGINKQQSILDPEIKAHDNINYRLKSVATNVAEIENQIERLKSFLLSSAQTYEAAENNALHIVPAGITAVAVSGSQSAMSASDSAVEPFLKELSEKFKNATDNADKIKALLELLTNNKIDAAVKNEILKELKMPNFRIDGDKLKVLDSDFNKGAQGLARWYSLDNLDNAKTGTYAKVAKLLKQSDTIESISGILGKAGKIVDKAGPIASVLGVAAGASEEYFKDPKASTERKVSNAVVGGAEAGASMYAGLQLGAMIGSGIGSIIPGPGTIVGAAVGAGVGIVAGALISYGIDKAMKLKFIGNGKSLMDELEDGAATAEKCIGDNAVKTAKAVSGWFGGLFNNKPVTGAKSFA